MKLCVKTAIARWLGAGLLVSLLVGGGSNETISLSDEKDISTGTLTGFVSPIDIPLAEAVLFDNTQEIARVAFSAGVFAFEEVPVGTYRLEVRALGYQVNDAARGIHIRPDRATDLGRVIMIGLDDGSPRTPFVEGIVLNAATNAPIREVRVQATCPAGVCGVQHAVTDDNGAFRVPIPASFKVVVLVDAPGYEGKGVVVEPVSRGETKQVDFRLIPRMP